MGIGGISIGSLVIVLVIVILLFGTKKLRNMGGDLGSALKNFKTAMKDESADDEATDTQSSQPIESSATKAKPTEQTSRSE